MTASRWWPLWVKSRHMRCKKACPLCPKKPTFVTAHPRHHTRPCHALRKASTHLGTVLRAVMRHLLVPDQKPAPDQGHDLDQDITDDGDLHDAGEYAGRIGKPRRRHHGAAEAVTPHEHFRDDGHD